MHEQLAKWVVGGKLTTQATTMGPGLTCSVYYFQTADRH